MTAPSSVSSACSEHAALALNYMVLVSVRIPSESIPAGGTGGAGLGLQASHVFARVVIGGHSSRASGWLQDLQA